VERIKLEEVGPGGRLAKQDILQKDSSDLQNAGDTSQANNAHIKQDDGRGEGG